VNAVGPTIRRGLDGQHASHCRIVPSAGLSSLHLPCTRPYARRRHADRDVQATGQWLQTGLVALDDGRQLLAAAAVTDAAVSANGVTICGWAGRQNAVSPTPLLHVAGTVTAERDPQ
jgi:hypothetical protein